MLMNQQAEIERLTALLQAAEARAALTDNASTPLDEQTVATLLESIVRSIGPLGSLSSTKLAKILDPPILTDGKDPAFDSWKIQTTGKLQINADHFATKQAQIAYVFSHTSGNA
jgi:hypothetical protein